MRGFLLWKTLVLERCLILFGYVFYSLRIWRTTRAKTSVWQLLWIQRLSSTFDLQSAFWCEGSTMEVLACMLGTSTARHLASIKVHAVALVYAARLCKDFPLKLKWSFIVVNATRSEQFFCSNALTSGWKEYGLDAISWQESSPTPNHNPMRRVGKQKFKPGASADYLDTIQSLEVASCQGMPRQDKQDVLCIQNCSAYWP